MSWPQLNGSPARAFWLSFSILLSSRFVFAACSVQYHIDGDNTVSLLQANDWNATPQRLYFWGQNYMGTTEVWLFSSLWRLFFGSRSTLPLLYWVFCAQLLFALGAALVISSLVFTERSFWGRSGVFVLSTVVLGFGVPVFQKYTFGVGHGYSAGPLYAGITVACYLFRERLSWWPLLLSGALLGQSHYICRLHIVYPIALAASLLGAGPRRNAAKLLALAAGTGIGMLPEKFLLPKQNYASEICLTDPMHSLANGWSTLAQAGVHFGTLPYSLLESEHALWFASHRPVSDVWIWWGEYVGAALLVVLLTIDVMRSLRSPTYSIFVSIIAFNFAMLLATCLTLDLYSARRYMHPSLFSIAFLMLHPPWTIWHRIAITLRTATFAVYAVSALKFSTPLAKFAHESRSMQFDRRQDCLVGSGGDLSALIALNGLPQVQTIDLDWRLRENYSRNVAANRDEVRNKCRQVFWIDSRGAPKKPIQRLCKLDREPYFSSVPVGIVDYPQQVRFYRCVVGGRTVN